jgi:hypothetical protein
VSLAVNLELRLSERSSGSPVIERMWHNRKGADITERTRAPGKSATSTHARMRDSFTYRKAAQAGLRVRVHTRTSMWTTLEPYEDPPETTV